MLVLLYVFLLPFLMVAFVGPLWACLVFNFVCVLTYWALHEISYDIEEPFVYDPNDLPLSRYQYMLNERMLAFVNNPRPQSLFEMQEKHPLRMSKAQLMVDMKRRDSWIDSKTSTYRARKMHGIVGC